MIKTYTGNKLTAFIVSVGDNPIAFRALPTFKAEFPGQLILWNNGSSFDYGIKLKSLADIYIDSSHNMWLSKTSGFAVLYLEYDWLLLTGPDMIFRPGWWSYVEPLMKEHIGIIGGELHGNLGDVKECDSENLADAFTLINRKMVNQIGGISPAFGIWGHELTDLQLRALAFGWKILSVNVGVESYGDGHSGVNDVRASMGNEFDRMHDRNRKVISRRGYMKNWFTNELP